VKISWYESQGHKYYKQENYDKALSYYLSALKNTEREFEKPYEMEYITRTFIKLENYKDALYYAEESLRLYKKMENVCHLQRNRNNVYRMQDLITQIKKELTPSEENN
jgi:tetratricopeptide (TPR) repeat protein